MKSYNKLFFFLATLSIFLGFILPALISSNSDLLTMLGFLIITGLLYTGGRMIVRQFNNE